MTRAVVTGCNLKFLDGARGLLRSVRHFHPDIVRYCLAPAEEAAEIQQGLGELGQVVTQPRPVAGVPDNWKLQLLAARVFIPTFGEDVIAWIDSDVVLCQPADELWNVPSGQANVVQDAVYNLGRMVPDDVWDHFARYFGVKKTDRGFNAGVYALRREDWFDLPERYETAIVEGKYPYYPPGFDQALLNGLLGPKANWLPGAYNAHALFEFGLPAGTRIIHYTDNPKPWMPGYGKHLPGYYEWIRYGEGETSPFRLGWLGAYYSLSTPRRLGYKAVRKALMKIGVWEHRIGVSNGPGTPTLTTTRPSGVGGNSVERVSNVAGGVSSAAPPST